MQTEAVDLKKNTQNTTTKRISTHCEIVKQVRPPSSPFSSPFVLPVPIAV